LARVNLPWAYYDIGKFRLLMDEPEAAVDAYCKAISVSSASFMVETSLASLERMGNLGGRIRGFESARRLLLLGLAERFRSEDAKHTLRGLASAGASPIEGPVLIVAGGTDPEAEEALGDYRDLVLSSLTDFRGTAISGGTTQGISGMVGDLGHREQGRIHTIGYAPASIPGNATLDEDPTRYHELRRTGGGGFSALEPLQAWIDLVSSGITPADIRVLGMSGGPVSAAEYRIALALGATVGLFPESGREAAAIFTDSFWVGSPGLIELSRTPDSVRAFFGKPREVAAEEPGEDA
jgi:hypothetical protein